MYASILRFEDGIVKPVNFREATIKEVATILKRDKGSPGDSDGREKLFAYKELGAACWIADFRSPGRINGYEGDELIEDAIRNFNLPSDWRPDKVVLDLIKLFEYHNNGGVAGQTLSEIAATFNLMLKTVKTIRVKLTEKLQSANITEDELKNLISLSNELLKLASSIPKMVNEIDTAKEMLKATEITEELGKGGTVITSSMR